VSLEKKSEKSATLERENKSIIHAQMIRVRKIAASNGGGKVNFHLWQLGAQYVAIPEDRNVFVSVEQKNASSTLASSSSSSCLR